MMSDIAFTRLIVPVAMLLTERKSVRASPPPVMSTLPLSVAAVLVIVSRPAPDFDRPRATVALEPVRFPANSVLPLPLKASVVAPAGKVVEPVIVSRPAT